MTKGQLLGANVKETICPKCSAKGNFETDIGDIVASVELVESKGIIRTFVRDKKGVWQCTVCNHKLGRDKRVFPFTPRAMVMKVNNEQMPFVAPKRKVYDGMVIPSVFN